MQPLFRGFRTVSAVSAAEATVRAGRETLRLAEQSVLLEAVTAFGDVVRDAAIVRLRENNVTVLTRDLRATQDRFNVGEVTRTDVAQAQARRAAAVAALDLARANLKTSPGHLRARDRPSAELPGGAARQQPGGEVAGRRTSRSRCARARTWWARSTASRRRASTSSWCGASCCRRCSWRPTTPSASTTRSALDWSETSSVTGRLTVPFYTGGEVQARVRQAKQTHIQRLQEIEQARTETQAQVVTAWSQLQAAQAAVESDNTAVNANRIALAGVREEERVGQRTLLDVLNAEQELLNSEVNLATDQRNVVVASYTVLSTIGRLNAQDLGVAALVYDPEAHYHDVRRKWFDISITHSDGRREVLEAAPPPQAGKIGRAGVPSPQPAIARAHTAVYRSERRRRWCSAQASAIERWGRQFFSHAAADRVLLGTGTPVAAWE